MKLGCLNLWTFCPFSLRGEFGSSFSVMHFRTTRTRAAVEYSNIELIFIHSNHALQSIIAQTFLKLILFRPPGTSVPGRAYILPQMFFSPRFLRDPSTDRPETLPHDQNLAVFYKLTSKIRGGAPPKKFGGQKHAKFRSIFDHFRL